MTTQPAGTEALDHRQLLTVLNSVSKGDFTARMPIDLTGLPGKIADALNDIIEKNQHLTSELGRISTVVGKEGQTAQRASDRGATGSWASNITSINTLIVDLLQPTTEVARVIGAVANGDLSQSMALEIDGRPLTGEFLRTAKTVNTMVDQLNAFASEVTRVAREVGTEGKLGGRAEVKGVAGTWKDLTDNVNSMAGNLTGQVRNIAEVATAIANGDLTKKITVDVQGEILDLKNTINTMVDQLNAFASEVTRVAREVGTEGKLGGKAEVKGVAGTWKDLTDNVNSMASNLTGQVRNIAEVATAIASGDLTKKITVDVRGEILELKNTINTMVDQLNAFASEVTRVAREVGTEGKLGGRAEVKGVAGTWKDLTDNVNSMAGNLTAQVRNIADVTTAVANGDLSKKITVDVQGEILELKNTINIMVDQLNGFASEVTRVAREVGTEGKLGGRAEVKGVAGTWKDLTDNVNSMAGNLTAQVRNIAEVTTAVANGDLSKKITVDVQGEILELKNTINIMVDQLNGFASEVTRVAREVGTEGKLGGKAEVKGVAGTWKDLTDSVNSMAGNLTGQVRNIAEVATAIANGDLSKKITVDVQGEILDLKNTINIMVDQLNGFASEVTRVAREVGTEGKLGGRAEVKGVAGTWKDLTDNVNSMAGNLTAQVRNIAEVTTAVANGDLTKKITVNVQGEILELKNTINIMVDQLNGFASEVTRVAREVGTEGKLGGRADVKGVAGTWKDLTDNVNSMAGNLTAQVRNIAEVTTAVANGDLSKKITVDVQGEILELKNTINIMVDQLNGFASEVTRVAREVGTEGKLGGRAEVKGVAGTWKDLTDNVNSMAGNLTAQVRNIAEVTTAVANGDLTKKITVNVQGEILELKNTINTMVDQLNSFASEVTRVAREVGTAGKLGGQAYVSGVAGTWKDLTDNVNFMASNLTNQVKDIAGVATAIANGDLTKKITVEAAGEILDLKNTINTMVDQLNAFASEVTRVAREVGTEGKLGGQAQVRGVSGTWKDLTDNVNFMADNLTNQVRGIARVVTAVANGDLKRKLTLEAKGEIAELADTINSMIDTLATFADQVTSVAREVGIEGKLGGQASVPGASGTWRDLTDNVNRLATTLTTQIRAIAEVATAVTTGDLSRSITVEAAGEVASLKDNINEMIRNLRDTTRINTEQDWLKTNVARFTRLLQGQRDLITVSRLILSELAPLVSEQAGVFYINENSTGGEPMLKLLASYGYSERKTLANRFKPGEGLVGQCVLERQRILLTEVPDDYIQVSSGLGESRPRNIVVLPVVFEGDVLAVIELASLNRFSETQLSFLDQLTESIGIVLNTIAANMRTEELLKQSQSLTQELQKQQEELQETNRRLELQAASLQASEERLREQQEELRQTNEQLEEKAKLLYDQNSEVERKNLQIEMARQELAERAEQLSVSSKYKSEFLANMSHELRTPLNSMLILSRLLSDNSEGNLSDRQIEFASTIHSSGNDLLALINEILDMAKIESGTMEVHPTDIPFEELRDYVDRNFREIAVEKGLDFVTELAADLPPTVYTDSQRLQQVLRNLLSNAVKFTAQGTVALRIEAVTDGWSRDHALLGEAASVIAFSVADTGIGIPLDRQKMVFEAFQQGDGTTSRKYGGTGLGLSISREIATLLGGEIQLASRPGEGSVFTLYLPQTYLAPLRHSDVMDALLDGGGRQHGDGSSGIPAPVNAVNPMSPVNPASDGSPGATGSPLGRAVVASNRAGSTRQISSASSAAATPHASVASTVASAYVTASATEATTVPATPPELRIDEISDDRKLIAPNDEVFFVIESDREFAAVILDAARTHGFKGVVAIAGDSIVGTAKKYRPRAVMLDVALADMNGWTVLDRLKRDPETRHIPVYIIADPQDTIRGLRQGAAGCVSRTQSPVDMEDTLAQIREDANTEGKKLLVVAQHDTQRTAIGDIAGGSDITIVPVSSTEEAVQALDTDRYDCVIIDSDLPGTVVPLLDHIRRDEALRRTPIVVYTAKTMTGKQEAEVRRMAESLVVKQAQTPEQLLEESTLFLHRARHSLSVSQQEMLAEARKADSVLAGKKVLVVDDDIRNIFALTSLMEKYKMDVSYAENGKAAVETLAKGPSVDVVLMDVMMPEMDGYETMRAIRKRAKFRNLPIIALTAKAMRGDRENCMQAGASDYIAKPVDTEQLMSTLRTWLNQ